MVSKSKILGVLILVVVGYIWMQKFSGMPNLSGPDVTSMAKSYAEKQGAFKASHGFYAAEIEDLGLNSQKLKPFILVSSVARIPEWVEVKLPPFAKPMLSQNNYQLLILDESKPKQFWLSDQSGKIIKTGVLIK